MRISVPTALLFTAIAGSAKNFETLAVCRFIASFAISPAATVSVGFLNDLWDVALSKTGTLLALICALMKILPSAMGPSTGAALVQRTGDCRWTFWLNAIFLGFIVLLTFPILETHYPYITKKHAKKDMKKRVAGQTTAGEGFMHTLPLAFIRPVTMMQEPIVFVTSLASTIQKAILFCW